MSLSLTAPPLAEPVTLQDAKAHLKIEDTCEDALIEGLIVAARARCEWYSGRALLTQSWCLYLDGWPRDGIVEIPLPPLQGVEEVRCTLEDGSTVTLSPDRYHVDIATAPGRLMLKRGVIAPTVRRMGGIAIAFTAGYGDSAAVPQAIKQAVLATVADLHAHRGDDDALVCPRAAALIAPYRMFRL